MAGLDLPNQQVDDLLLGLHIGAVLSKYDLISVKDCAPPGAGGTLSKGTKIGSNFFTGETVISGRSLLRNPLCTI